MAPKRYLTQKDVKKRKQAFEENRQMSHWPGGGQSKIFPKSVRAFSAELAAHHKERMAELRKNPIYSCKPRLTALGESLLAADWITEKK